MASEQHGEYGSDSEGRSAFGPGPDDPSHLTSAAASGAGRKATLPMIVAEPVSAPINGEGMKNLALLVWRTWKYPPIGDAGWPGQ